MQKGVYIEKEIRFVGLQRSGNHAVINWILKQCEGDILFFNDVDSVDPLDSSRIMQGDINSDCLECLLYSYEDRLLNAIARPGFYPENNSRHTNVRKRYDVLVIRDPFNFFASRSKHAVVLSGESNYISGLSVPNLWITYAKEYLNETSYLKNNKIVINYNRWCVSRSYRKKIAENMGLVFTDRGFSEVTNYGSGSSFDELKFNKEANMMKTDSRWANFKNSQEYVSLFSDKQIVEYSNKIFEIDDNLKLFIKNELQPRYSRKSELKRYFQIGLVPWAIAFAKESKVIRYLYYKYFLEKRKKAMFQKRKPDEFN